jgi:hypothetical protein
MSVLPLGPFTYGVYSGPPTPAVVLHRAWPSRYQGASYDAR